MEAIRPVDGEFKITPGEIPKPVPPVQYNTYLNKYVMMYTDSANNVMMRTAEMLRYAPMQPWSAGQDIYWNMSSWGDCNVLLMHMRLV
jgi:hypothetical protein